MISRINAYTGCHADIAPTRDGISYGTASDLQSRRRGFNSQPGCYQVATTWMGSE